MRGRSLLLVAAMVLAPVAIGYLVFFGTPLTMLGLETVRGHHHPSGFSGILLPGSYGRMLSSPLYRRLLGETFRLAGACSLICLLVGYPIAWLLRLGAERLKRGGGSGRLGSIGPTVINVVMRGMGWMVVLGEFGLVNLVLRTLRVEADLTRRSHLLSELAELSSMVQVFFPFMVLALYGAVARIDLNLLRAARNLGATRTRAFFEVVVPLSLPGAAIGVVTVFALATGAYVTVATIGGIKVRAMADSAYAESSTLVNWQLGAAVLAVVLISAAVLVRLLLAALRRADPASPPAQAAVAARVGAGAEPAV
jgi:putative spermidine/putrescine transport system permease protein